MSLRRKVKRKVDRYFKRMVWLIMGDENVRNLVAGLQGAKNIFTESPPGLMCLDSWWYISYNTQDVAGILVQIANDNDFLGSYVGDAIEFLQNKYTDTCDEVDIGPWDLGGEEGYDSGYCVICNNYSTNLRGGICPNC